MYYRELTLVEKIYKEMFEAFSVLSDVQELLNMGFQEEANTQINHAKKHMLKAGRYDEEAYQVGICSGDFVCSLTAEAEEEIKIEGEVI